MKEEEEEEEEGERRIKPKHSLLHAVAVKENKEKTTEEEGACTRIQTPIYMYIYIHTHTHTVHVHTHTYKYTHDEIWLEMKAEHNDCLDRQGTEGRQQVM